VTAPDHPGMPFWKTFPNIKLNPATEYYYGRLAPAMRDSIEGKVIKSNGNGMYLIELPAKQPGKEKRRC